MKHQLLAIIGTLLITGSMAQNGGQSPVNNYVNLEYRGYSGGYYALELTNKQSCGVDFQIEWLGNDTTIYVLGNTIKTIQLPGSPLPHQKIKAKPLYRCGSSGGDLGFVEVITPASLPATYENLKYSIPEKGKIKISFDAYNVDPDEAFSVQFRTPDGEFANCAVILPNGDGHYNITLIKKYKENKPYFETTFK